MDAAKGINFLLTNGGRMADYRGSARRRSRCSLGRRPDHGRGQRSQSYALITDERTHMKMACGTERRPFASASSTRLTLSQPKVVTAVTGIDALAHAVESYVCQAKPVSQAFRWPPGGSSKPTSRPS